MDAGRAAAHLGVFPPAEVVSAVVLPQRVAAGVGHGGGGGGGGRGHRGGAGGRGQTPDAVKLHVAHSHGAVV